MSHHDNSFSNEENGEGAEDHKMNVDEDEESVQAANEEDFIYLDEEQLEAMDQDQIEEEDDFQTINEESMMGDGLDYQEGQILEQGMVPDDSVVHFGSGQHKDSIFSIGWVPREPYNTFISGDCDDKAIVWKIIKDDTPDEIQEGNGQEEVKEPLKVEEVAEGGAPRMKVKTALHKYLEGHTETVEFIKFNHDGKLLATAGMNNQIRIWNAENDFELKFALEDGPSEDLNYLEWHPKGNVIMTGGKDKLIWMFNGQNGQFISCLQGHTGDIYNAQFTINDGGKHVISCSSDKTVRFWSPMKNTCLQVMKAAQGKIFHDAEINVFGQHYERPLILSGDLSGKVYYSSYQTGEIGGLIGDHADSVEAICFNRQFPIAVSAGIDTNINIYDLTKTEMRNKFQPAEYGGYSKLQFSLNNPNILYAASTMGELYCIDVRDGKVVNTLRGNTGPINDFIEVKPLEIVVTAGDDRECRVFDVRGLNAALH